MTLQEAMNYRGENPAQALDGGILIAEDGAEVELYGSGGRV